MTRRSSIPLCALSVAMFCGARAHAHVSLEVPKARYWSAATMMADQSAGKQKTGPCGASRDARTTDASLITTFKPGEKVTVKWSETIQHPGHFELSFDTDGQDFPTPGTAPAADSGVTVLAANIADKSSKAYSYEITLPNMECSKCTLQLVQVMTTAAPPYGKNDLYFNCADIVIKADGGGAGGAGGAGGGTTGGVGGSVGGGAGGSAAGGASANGGSAGGFGVTGGSLGASGASTSGGATGQGFGGAASGGVGTTSSGGASGSGGASTSSGGAPGTSGGAPSASGGAPNASGGALIGSGGSTSQPPGGVPEEPEGCALVGPRRSRGAGGLVLAAAGLGLLSRWRRRRRAR